MVVLVRVSSYQDAHCDPKKSGIFLVTVAEDNFDSPHLDPTSPLSRR